MLPSAASLANDLLGLTPTQDPVSGVNAFVTVLGNFINQVQAGSTGTAGILTFGNTAMEAALLTMQPVKDNSWINNFANAWEAGVNTGVIAPSTVTLPVWTGSGNKDTETLPSTVTTITTISAAKTILISGLTTCKPTAGAPIDFANAIRNSILAFKFNCIGLGPPPTFTPIPVPTSAE